LLVASFADQLSENILDRSPGLTAGMSKPGLQRFDRPVGNAICCIVEHLADNLAPDPAVTLALYLNQSGDSILVEKHVVHRPLGGADLSGGDRLLAAYQHPSARVLRVDLVANQQFGETR